MRTSAHRAASLLCTVLFAVLFCAVFPGDSRAENPPAAVSRPALLDIARQLVQKVGDKLEKTGQGMDSDEDRLSSIPDGEALLFRVRIDGKIDIDGDIMAEKHGRELLVSLRDFLATTQFPIRFDVESKNAQGWYIREEKNFRLNWDAGKVESAQGIFDIPESAVATEEDLLIPMSVLAAWFDLTL